MVNGDLSAEEFAAVVFDKLRKGYHSLKEKIAGIVYDEKFDRSKLIDPRRNEDSSYEFKLALPWVPAGRKTGPNTEARVRVEQRLEFGEDHMKEASWPIVKAYLDKEKVFISLEQHVKAYQKDVGEEEWEEFTEFDKEEPAHKKRRIGEASQYEVVERTAEEWDPFL
mmetsp:Transcript_3413/g.12979  ORF Transcript_3413/g.12979 Transcript_3413/m.12979 type:complete len:167 (-) Transcript_3413:2824-3324(-)